MSKPEDNLRILSQEMLQLILQHIPDVLWTTDHEGNTVFISPNVTSVYGYTPGEICSSGHALWFQRIHPDDVARVTRAYADLFADEKPFDVEYRIQRKDGAWIWLQDRALTTYEKDRKKYASGIFRDISEQKRSEELLRAQEERYRAVVENQNEFIVRHTPDGKRTFVNEAYCRYFSVTAEEIIGKSFYPLIPENQREAVRKKLQLLTPENNTVTETHEAFRSDGKRAWQEWTSVGIFDETGELVEVQSVGRDVTARRQAEQIEKTLARIFNTTTDSITISRLSNGEFLFVNPAFTEIFQYTADEVKGKSSLDLDIWVRAEDRVKWISELQANGRIRNFETSLRTRDGKTYIGSISASLIDVENEDCLLAITRDITAQKLAEEEIRASEEKYRILIENSQDIAYAMDLEGNLTFLAPQAARYGIDPDTAISRNILEFVAPEDRERVTSTLREAVATGVDHPTEFRIVGPDGNRLWLEERASIHRNTTGDIIGISGLIRDITQRKQAELALEQSEEKLAKIINTTPDAVAISRIEDGVFIYVNPAFTKQFKFPESEVLGKSSLQLDLWPRPEERDALVGELMNNGRITNYETEFRTRDGNIFSASISASLIVIEGQQCILILIRDITEQKLTLLQHDKSLELYQQSLIDTIRAIGMTVEKRDPYTAGHQNRVAQLSTLIARELSLPDEQIHGIELGATIHDIGKIYIPAEILNRPGKLTRAEYEMIKSHPEVGYDIIKDISFPWPVAEMIRSHHERLDGSGYPDGLKNEKIILEAQIIAVADVVEAISSHRPYRPALGIEVAIEEIRKTKGTQFNPDVVDVCVKLIEEQGFRFEPLQ